MAYFDLKVGYSCNNDCVHCVIAGKRSISDLTTEKIKLIIRKRPKQDSIGFTGGEVTIREDFFDIVKYAKKRGHLVSLQTNGTRFADWSFAKEASKHIDGILIAIHSACSEIHDKVVQNSGMHAKTIQGFKNIVKLNIPHRSQTVISKINADYLEETFDYIQSISAGTRMSLTYPHPNGNAYSKSVVPRYSDIRTCIQRVLKKYASLLTIEAIPICYLYPYQDQVVNVDEELINHISIKGFDSSLGPDLIEDYSARLMKEKRKGQRCRNCIFDSRCPGVWKEYVEFYGDNFDLFPVLAGKKKVVNF